MTKVSEGRLEAIAFNALQESRKAHGIGDMPWGDKDARLQAMITKLLGEVQTKFTDSDLGLITPSAQVEVSKPLVNVEQLLESLGNEEPIPTPRRSFAKPVVE